MRREARAEDEWQLGGFTTAGWTWVRGSRIPEGGGGSFEERLLFFCRQRPIINLLAFAHSVHTFIVIFPYSNAYHFRHLLSTQL